MSDHIGDANKMAKTWMTKDSNENDDKLHPEIDLMRKLMKHWGYTGVQSDSVWFPSHCFGDHRIVLAGCEWTLHNGVCGHGLTNLVLAMTANKYQPLDRPEQTTK